jgi:hypothetical protein
MCLAQQYRMPPILNININEGPHSAFTDIWRNSSNDSSERFITANPVSLISMVSTQKLNFYTITVIIIDVNRIS